MLEIPGGSYDMLSHVFNLLKSILHKIELFSPQFQPGLRNKM